MEKGDVLLGRPWRSLPTEVNQRDLRLGNIAIVVPE
jgi:hypothetical protein